MTKDSQATTNETPGRSSGGNASSRVYMDFWFLKLDPSFSLLQTNEKVVARQEFLTTFDQFPHRLPISVYGLDGLNSESDLLIWRISPDLEDFHTMAVRLRRSGFGRYLIPTSSYTGSVPSADYPFEPRDKGSKESAPIGNKRFLLIAPVSTEQAELLRGATADGDDGQLHLMDCRGLDKPAFIAAYETDDALGFGRLLNQRIPNVNVPTTACVRTDAADLIESAG